jgi:hypothetical protein
MKHTTRIAKIAREFCDAIAKCKSADLSEGCIKYQGMMRSNFRISQKNCDQGSSTDLMHFARHIVCFPIELALLNLSPENRLQRLSPSWPG